MGRDPQDGAGALVLVAAIAASAVGHWLYDGGNPAHIHVKVHWFLNEVDQSSNARSNTREAQIEWHQDTILDLSSTSSHDTARFHVVDAYYGNTAWVGTGEYCYHCGHLHTRLNLSYPEGDDRATTCQEIGHNIGEDHHPATAWGPATSPSGTQASASIRSTRSTPNTSTSNSDAGRKARRR